MADLGECFATAAELGHKPSPDQWYDAWRRRADRTGAIADGSPDPVTRRSAWLRASEYYRQAFFFLRHDIHDPRLLDAYRRHVATFVAAAELLDVHAEAITITAQGTSYKGWLFAPDDSRTARPTVLMPCGYDSTAEEGFAYVSGALARGYNAVTFEGPGQGAALYLDHIPFRADFVPVVTAVVDELVARPDVRTDAIVLLGLSFAGYLAPQAATGEHRLAALICNPGQPDMGAKVPSGVAGRLAAPAVRTMMHISHGKAEFFGARMAAHGITDISDYVAELERFNMLDAAAGITCPTLILECAGDFAGGGGAALHAALHPDSATTLVHLGDGDGASGHCAGMGQHVWEARAYDWLATVLNP